MSLNLNLLLFALVFGLMACSNYNGKGRAYDEEASEGTAVSQKIYVESAEPAALGGQDEGLQIKISGNLPSPAYSFDKFDVVVKNNVITITPLASYDSGKMAAQVLVPFEKVCNVSDLKPGDYDIKVVGRGDQVLKSNKVQVR